MPGRATVGPDGGQGKAARNPPPVPIVSSVKEETMAKRKPHIAQDERGQDQPTSKRAAHHTETTMPKDASDLDPRDIGSGVHDSVIEEGRPRPDRASG